MANNDNIIYAKFNHGREITTDSRSQYAYGQVLKISGLHLPASFDADISNKGDKQAVPRIGTNNELEIDDAFFLSGKDVIVMINVHAADKDGRTKYIIRIPVEKRPERADIELEPVEQDVISVAIATLNEAVEQTSASAESAENSANRAHESAISAEQSATNASNSEALVEQYMNRAETAAEGAEQSETKAKTSEVNAKASETHAEQIATEIEQFTGRAETASTSAESSATTASQKAAEASNSADIATAKATEASTSATNAHNSETSAQQSASDAFAFKNSASASASSAFENAQQTGADRNAVESAKQTVLTAVSDAQSYAATAQSASQAIQDMDVEAVTLEVGSDVTVEKTVDPVTGAVTLTYGIPKGVKGDKGDKGDTGEKGDKGDTGEVSLKNLYSHFITNTASGAIASFENGADNVPMKDVKVQIEPVQDLNGQDSPYPPGGGKNIAYLEQGSLDLNTGAEITSTTRVRTNFIPVEQATTYIASSQNNGWSIRNGVGYDANREYVVNAIYPHVSTGLLTVNNASVKFVRLVYSHTTTSESCAPSDYWYQFEKGSTATDYAPYSNICPINGWTVVNVNRTGKNLFNESNVTFGLWIDSSGNVTSPTSKAGCVSDYICVSAPNTVTVMFNGVTPYSASIIEYTSNKEFIIRNHRLWTGSTLSPLTVSLNADTKYIRVQVFSNGGTVVQTPEMLASEKIQLEFGSTATEYEPYQGETYSIEFPSETGTIYGGTLDVTTGELVVDKASVDLGTLSWELTDSTNSIFKTTSLYNHAITTSMNISCSQYKTVTASMLAADMPNKSIKSNASQTSWMYVKDTSYTDATAFTTAMSGVQLVYELETPQTYQLAPTEITSLLGTNNVWADTGDITAVYRADAKLYIDSIDFPVDDIQINGTSIVENGVANIPIADSSTLGVMKPSSGLYVGSTGALYTNKATSASIKTGTNNYLPIVPSNQHEASFYGLAKAAGDTTQSASDNEVGQYTDNAKTAINRMLGIKYDPDSLAVMDTATGNVASFEDGADNVPFNDVKVKINPVQDLHGYDSPWAAGSGKNLLNPDNVFGASAYYTINSDGSITVLKSNDTAWDNGTNFPISLEVGTYTVSRSVMDGALTIRKASNNYEEDICRLGPNATSGSFTLDSNDVIRIKFNSGSAVTYPSTSFFQLEKGETATAWAPYENICPITGWTGTKVTRTGKNLLNDDRSAYQKDSAYLRLKNVVPDGVEARFTFSDKDTSIDTSGCYIGFFYTETVNNGYRWVVENGVIKQNTSNVANTGYYTGEYCSNVMIYPNTDECFNKLFSRYNIMIELGSTASSYAPYQGNTYDITFPTEAGTVYGGTLDVTTGELVVDRAMVDLGTFTWIKKDNAIYGFATARNPWKELGITNVICDTLKTSSASSATQMEAYSIKGRSSDSTLFARIEDDMTQTQFREWMSGKYAVYELKTPITYQFTSTEIRSLLGINNVWADTGDSTVEYRADTKLYISKKITEAVSALS